jgi:hypothetical protein
MAFVIAWQIRADAAPSIAVLIGGLVLLLLALSFQTLTVFDEDEYLVVRYGPIDLFGTRIAINEITAFEKGKTNIIDGWGIHFIPFRGWTFNLWGFECVKIVRGAKTVRLGTDDSENLFRFLEQRLGRTGSPAAE